jgi:tape measure domain-containing protein
VASLGSLVATIRVDVGSAIADVNAVATAIQRSLAGALSTVSGSLGSEAFSGMRAAAEGAAAGMQRVAQEAAKVNTEVREGTGLISSWDDYLRAASAEYQRLAEIAGQTADFTNRSLKAQQELNRVTAFRGAPGVVAPRSVDVEMGRVQRDPATGRFMASIEKQLVEIRDRARETDLAISQIGDGFSVATPLADQLTARFRAMDAALLNVRVHAQGFAGHLRVSVEPLERIARAAQRVGHNLNASSVSAHRLRTGLEQASAAAGRLNAQDMRRMRNELANLAAFVLPGRAGSMVFGFQSLARLMGTAGAAGAGFAAGLGAVAVGAYATVQAIQAVTGALSNLISTGFQAGAGIENLLISFEALTGSAEEAHGEVQALVDLATKSPFKLDTLLALDRMLLSQGVKSGELRESLVRSIDAIGAAFGRSDDDILNLGKAVAQVFGRGYLSGDELRQLYNQMVPIWDLLRTLPEFTGESQAAIRKLSEQQEISAIEMGRAFGLFAQDLAMAAEMQANSITGLKLRIEELREARLGLAFVQVEDTHLGPLEAVQAILIPIVETLERIDFRPLAASIGNLFGSLLRPFNALVENGGFLVNLFQRWIPGAINFLALVIEEFRQGIGGIGNTFAGIWNVVKQVAPFIGIAFAVAFGSIISGINVTIAAFGALYSAIGVVIGLVRVFFAFFTGGARGAVSDTFDSLRSGVASFGDLATSGSRALDSTLDLIAGVRNLTVEVDDFGKEAEPNFANTGEMMEHVAEEAGKDGAAGAVSELNKAMNELFELTRRIFGRRSDLEEGLLGSEGFTATIDSIVNMGAKLIEIMTTLGQRGIVDMLVDSTEALIRLAERRELVAEKLANAEDALQDAIDARDKFAEGLRQTALDFANALSVEEQTEQRWRHIAAQGFFVVEEIETQETFTEALKRRLKALREFFAGIKQLRGAGLDPDLLAQLFAAGPEQAGDIVKGLLEGGASAIQETNALQNQITTLADQMAAYGAKQWHAVGVAEAQALVDGLKGEMAVIEASAIEITELVYETVLPFAKKMEEQGAAMGSGVASGLSGSIPEIGGAMFEIEGSMANHQDRWDKMMSEESVGLTDPVEAEFDGMLAHIETVNEQMIEAMTGPDGMVTTIQETLDSIEIDVLEWLPEDDGPWMEKLAQWLEDRIEDALGINIPEHSGPVRRGPPPPGSTFNDQEETQTSLMAAPQVNVFIGDQELKGMISTEMVVAETDNAIRVVRGRR